MRSPESMTTTRPLVSVGLMTYNQRRWIDRCIEGIRRQDTSFKLEVVIGDDGSDDGTTDICRRFADDHPAALTVRHIVRDRNAPDRAKYSKEYMHNLTTTQSECSGKYVAILEGDDFWRDPQKLQTQVDFLEAHPEYSMCIHNAAVARADRVMEELWVCPERFPEYAQDTDYTVLDWPRVLVPTCSFVLRREVMTKMLGTPLRFGNCLDIPVLHVAQTLGKIRFMHKAMACYRVHVHGQWNGAGAVDRYTQMLELTSNLLQYTAEASDDVRRWLQVLFDYNYARVAALSASAEEFNNLLAHMGLKDGREKFHSNIWLAQSAADLILDERERNERLLSSKSYKLGSRVVNAARKMLSLLPGAHRS
ncbi:MAG: glycosyltransferase family A protein [Verrucomicrobia bacterium]|nr:glycosyltransferase family A protein [Verrucomicrobiota bacterium]MDA1087836.1 glycosyltransferase family A protein [Verrucomicrobiota bacterium]